MRYRVGELVDSISKKCDFKTDKIIFLNTGDIEDGKIVNNNCYKISDLPGQAKKKIKNGDILFSEIRPKNKRYALVENIDETNYVVSTKLMVLRNKDSKVLNMKYFYYFLTSPKMLRYLQSEAEARSGTFPQITFKDNIYPITINLPSLAEQNKIVKNIDSIVNKIKNNQKINTNLKLLKTTIFNDMFNSKLLNNLNGKLADIAKIQTGKRPISRSSTYNNENKYPIVGASKIMGYTNSYNIDDSIITTGRVGTHGIIQRFREPVWISDNSFIFTSHYEDYLYEILKNRINYTSLNRGSTQPLITQTDLKNIDIYVPTDEEHRQFKTLIYPITNIEFILNNEQHKLFKIKNLLLNKFFNSSKLTN